MTLLPTVLTVALINFFFGLTKSWLEPIQRIEPNFIRSIPHSEIVLVILLIFAFGLISQLFALSYILESIEQLIVKRIPLFRQVYFGIKQLIHALNPQDQLSFKHVVYVPLWGKGYALGFMTNDVLPQFSPNASERHVSVFVPTTPNPTTGFYIVIPFKDCQVVKMTRQEAMTVIISGGIVQPDSIIEKDKPLRT